MKIKVTQFNIEKGLKRSPCECPIALALDKLPNNYNVSVGIRRVSVYNTAESSQAIVSFDLPLEASVFIYEFDNGFMVNEFSFNLPFEVEDNTVILLESVTLEEVNLGVQISDYVSSSSDD